MSKSKPLRPAIVTLNRDILDRRVKSAKRDPDIVLKLGAGAVIGAALYKLLS